MNAAVRVYLVGFLTTLLGTITASPIWAAPEIPTTIYTYGAFPAGAKGPFATDGPGSNLSAGQGAWTRSSRERRPCDGPDLHAQSTRGLHECKWSERTNRESDERPNDRQIGPMGAHTVVDRMGLAELVGLEVSAVSFVRDYVELHFDGPVLRSLSDPVVMSGRGEFRFPDIGSRDALCELIGREVVAAVDEPMRLMLRFDEQSAFVIPTSSDVAGAEIAHLVPFIDGVHDTLGMSIWLNRIASQ